MKKAKKNVDVTNSKSLHQDIALIYKKAIDTYVNEGKETSTLALSEKQRLQFFQERPTTEMLLKRKKTNPLLEEGKIEGHLRDRKGEFYLTPEAIGLLVEKKIIQNNTSYNKENIFIVENDSSLLRDILKNLNLNNDSDAKFIYVHGIHAIPFYLRKETEKIRCFIVDPEPIYEFPKDIIFGLETAFGNPCIIFSTTCLQKDFYSCSTFAIKALMYFVKHGDEIFPHLESKITLTTGQHFLDSRDLMPQLLKMSQDSQLFSDSILNAIVSRKAGKTLREYRAAYKRIIDDKVFNTAAIEKRYKYFSELNDFIRSQTRASISEDASEKLPKELAHIIEKFSSNPSRCSQSVHSVFIDFKTTLEKLIELRNFRVDQSSEQTKKAEFDQHVDQLLNSYPTDCEASKFLNQIIQDIKKHKNLLKVDTPRITIADPHPDRKLYNDYYNHSCYQQLMPYCQLANLTEKNGIAEEHALKLSILFDNTNDALHYIHKNIKINKLAIHDACLFILPDVSKCSFNIWKKKIKTYINDPNFRQLLGNLPELEKFFKEKSTKKLLENIREELQTLKTKIRKKNKRFKCLKKHRERLNDAEQEEYSQIVQDLSEMKKDLFEKSLGLPFEEIDLLTLKACMEIYSNQKSGSSAYLLKNGLTQKDYVYFTILNRDNAGKNIPDLTISHKDHPNYILRKLDVANSQRDAELAACLGKLTNCCQFLGGAGSSCVVHGLTNSNGGFYVLFNQEEQVIAQCWAWRSKKGAIVFDSIEAKNNKYYEGIIIQYFKLLAKEIIEKNYTYKVSCGATSGISSKMDGVEDDSVEDFIDYWGYCDSTLQKVLCDKYRPYLFYNTEARLVEETHKKIQQVMQNQEPLLHSNFLYQLINWMLLRNIIKVADLHNQLIEIARKEKREKELLNIIKTGKKIIEIDKKFYRDKSAQALLLKELKEEPLLSSIRLESGNTLLHKAVMNEEEQIIKYLLDQGLNVNSINIDNESPLHWAAEYSAASVKLLLDKGADVNAINRKRQTPLHIAANYNIESTVKLLLDKAADVNVVASNNGYIPLHYAAKWGNMANVKLLLNKGANIHAIAKNGNSLLHLALRGDCDEDFIKLLLDNGANVNALDKRKYYPLQHAIKSNDETNETIVKMLLDKGANVNGMLALMFRHRTTMLHFVIIKKCNEAIVKLLLDKLADVNAEDHNRCIPLHYAASIGNMAIAKLLLEKAANVNAVDKKGYIPLHYAVKAGNMTIVKLLLDKGANVNVIIGNGNTLLHFAIRENCNEAMIMLLLQHKDIEVNAPDEDGLTPLCLAFQKRLANVVSLLLQHVVSLHKNSNISNKDATDLLNPIEQKHQIVVSQLQSHSGALFSVQTLNKIQNKVKLENDRTLSTLFFLNLTQKRKELKNISEIITQKFISSDNCKITI